MLVVCSYFLYILFILLFFFFFNDTATTEIYTLSLHDALPISPDARPRRGRHRDQRLHGDRGGRVGRLRPDRKSTRLNSSHLVISYAVFCLKKKKKKHSIMTTRSTICTFYSLCHELLVSYRDCT